MTVPASLEDAVRSAGLDARSALEWARKGRVEAWVHHYLLSGSGGQSNPAFSEGLKRAPRWWNGPLELPLEALTTAVGPETGREYVVEAGHWQALTGRMARTLTDPLALPPMIAEYRQGLLSLRDGNTRYGAMRSLGWKSAWVIIWYNSQVDWRSHSISLSGV